jgi:hypothetical protein
MKSSLASEFTSNSFWIPVAAGIFVVRGTHRIGLGCAAAVSALSAGSHLRSRNGVCDLGISAKIPVMDPSAERMKEPQWPAPSNPKRRSDRRLPLRLSGNSAI